MKNFARLRPLSPITSPDRKLRSDRKMNISTNLNIMLEEQDEFVTTVTNFLLE
jgi:hypothetical protein